MLLLLLLAVVISISLLFLLFSQSVGAVEYTDCISAEG